MRSVVMVNDRWPYDAGPRGNQQFRLQPMWVVIKTSAPKVTESAYSIPFGAVAMWPLKLARVDPRVIDFHSFPHMNALKNVKCRPSHVDKNPKHPAKPAPRSFI